jgi:hypothetical protein
MGKEKEKEEEPKEWTPDQPMEDDDDEIWRLMRHETLRVKALGLTVCIAVVVAVAMTLSILF